MHPISIKCLKSETTESGVAYGKFLVHPLTSGQGITIGNQLRRVLLGDLGGVAISAVRFTGVNHEFGTLPGVREDILEILLNLKGIVFKTKSHITETQLGRLKIGGPSVITANSIQLPSHLEIVNPNHYIATMTDHGLFELEFKFDYGTGYQLASSPVLGEEENYLSLDTLFMPVQKVNFQIENVYDEMDNVSERLFLDIWTNGSLSPKEAVESASQMTIDLFTSLLNHMNPSEPNLVKVLPDTNILEPYTNLAIEELQLSVRAYNCLKKAQIHTVGDLLQYSPEKLQELKNFGRKSADEVFSTLKNKLGIILK